MARAAGVDGSEADSELEPDSGLWGLVVDIINSYREMEMSPQLDGNCDIVLCGMQMRPSMRRIRRHCSPRSWGPWAMLWWPYRYRGGLLRAVGYEAAL
jgi:hypothetical protein